MRDLEARIAEDDFDDEESGSIGTWLLNFILGLLGATVLGLAFFELDPNEERYLYNPWTYAIIVPIAMVMLSAVMSTLVSRIIRRSMQAAFLLSVLAHLLILTGLSNIVIHSRYWPQLFDSLAQQRQQLKKESLQARQYVKVSLSTQPNKRPDHLKHVPTEHQPTEIQRAEDRQMQLAKADVDHLITPKIELEKSSTAHLLKRSQAQSSSPSYSPQASSLSRSELSQPSPERSASPPTPSYEIYQSEPQLQASTADRLKSRVSESRSDAAITAPSNLSPQANSELTPSSVSVQRRAASSEAPASDTLAKAELPRRSSETAQPIAPSAIQTFAPSAEAPQSLSLATESQSSRRSSASGATAELPTESQAAPSENRSLASGSQLRRNDRNYQVINPTDGASSLSLSRSSAGGQAGPAARSSLPTLGSNLGSTSSADGELRAATDIARRSESGRQASALPQMPEAGSVAAAQWDGLPSLAGGVASRSPAQLAAEGTGQSNSNDVAAMTGAGRDIQRAAVGLAGPAGNIAVPSGAVGVESNQAVDLQAGGSSVTRANRSSKGGAVTSDPLSDTSGSMSQSSRSTQDRSLPSGMQRRETEGVGSVSDTKGLVGDLPRNDTIAGAAPSASKVNAPNIASGNEQALNEGLANDSSSLQRMRTSTGRLQIPLEIDAPSGSGGLANVPMNDSVALLPRRSNDSAQPALPQFDTQRFMRSEVGGPLAAGKSVAKPAFQQRLDRLQNRGDDETIDPQTELAIERGLEFLAKYQREDGSWKLQDFDTKVLIRSDTAATALAMLAFQGAGYTHKESKYALQVGRAIEFLSKNQKADGDLYIPQDPASDQNAWLYSHAIASLALCEAYGMTQDENLKPIAQKAVNFMVSSQDSRRGGWRYRPGVGSDTSVTGWYMMALQSGRLAGLNVPASTFDSIQSFVSRAAVSKEEPHLFRYNPFAPDTVEQRHGLQPTAVTTSVGLLIRLYMGWQRNDKEMIDGATYLLIHSPQNGTKEQSRRDTYYWYYATQVIFHMGGDYWKRWHDTLNPMLIKEQVREGRYAGSWEPMSPVPDLWANYGGRLYVTTMNLLSLEVSYRHLPLYEATAK